MRIRVDILSRLLLVAGLLLVLILPAAAETTVAPPLQLSEEVLEWSPLFGRHVAPAPDRAALEDLPVLELDAGIAGSSVLGRLTAQGRAGGLAGVIYDNRDRGHSALDVRVFPQLTPTRYDRALQATDMDYGLAGSVLFPAPVIGNSSTAVTSGPAPRSLGRLAMTVGAGPWRAWQEYAANHIYVYPAHRDHGEVDLFPANWPYMVLSQGSSHSDRPFVEALLLTLAAFPPETRTKLEASRLIAPTLQMILRRTQAGVYGRAAYLSGAAHPTVFSRDRLQPERMAAMAGAMEPGDIPPLVVMRVEDESFHARAGLADMSERLFDTPTAIARIWRGWEAEKEMVVSVEGARDPNGRELAFDWVLLRGDPERVRITPLDDLGRRAHVAVGWHERRPVMPRAERLSDRVDIGVFARNGVHDSAPAFVSVSFPAHEQREFETGPNGIMRLAAVDYDAIGRGQTFDPVLHWSAPWRDEFAHDERGYITGWTRHYADGRSENFGAVDTGTRHRVVRLPNRPPVLELTAPE
jgi:hypothetical protein